MRIQNGDAASPALTLLWMSTSFDEETESARFRLANAEMNVDFCRVLQNILHHSQHLDTV